MRYVRTIFSCTAFLLVLGAHTPSGVSFALPTNSSPIALTSDDKYVWAVNPNVDLIEPVVNDTVTVHDVWNDKNQKVAEIPVGDDPVCVALTPDNKKAYVTNHGSNTVTVINAQTYQVITTVQVGTEPWGCAVTPNGEKVYIANFSSDYVSVIRTSDDKVIRTIKRVGSKPRAIAISEDGKTVFVTLFLAQLREGNSPATEGLDDSKEGRVVVIDTKHDRVATTIKLNPALMGFSSRGSVLQRIPVADPANPDNTLVPTSGFPNLLQSIVIRGHRAYVPGTCSSPDGNARFNVNVQSCLSSIDINALAEVQAAFLNMNVGVGGEPVGKRLFNTNPLAIAFKKSKSEGFIPLAATNRLLRVELNGSGDPTINSPANIIRIELKDPHEITQPDPNDTIGSKNPRGIVINSTDTRAYVMSLITRDVAVVDIAGTDPSKYKTLARILSTDLPTPGSLAAIVSRGHQLFNTAIGPTGTEERSLPPAGRMSDFGWGSCYGCHPNGLMDGVTWMFGDGPRQTISMESTYEHPQSPTFLNAFGGPLLPNFKQRVLNWSAVRDECQDFELNIRNVSGGQGLIADGQAVVNLTPTSTTGRSADLDALCSYIAFGIRAPISPLRGQEESPGRQLFAAANCQQCHGGQNWTSSQVDFTPPPNAAEIQAAQLKNFLCDVGTFDPNAFNEVRAAGVTQVNPPILVANGVLGFNIPSLLSVFVGAPYLHNGQCPDLECVLNNVTHRSAGTGGVDTLSNPKDRTKLIRFLKTIDITTSTFPFVARPCAK